MRYNFRGDADNSSNVPRPRAAQPSARKFRPIPAACWQKRFMAVNLLWVRREEVRKGRSWTGTGEYCVQMICFLDARLKTKAADQTTHCCNRVGVAASRGARGRQQWQERDCMPHMPPHIHTQTRWEWTLADLHSCVCTHCQPTPPTPYYPHLPLPTPLGEPVCICLCALQFIANLS